MNQTETSTATVSEIPAEPVSSVLRNRHFLTLWIAQAITQTSVQMIWFAMIVVVESSTGSTAHLSAALLTTILPSVAFGLLAGVIVDRVDKKTVLVATNLLRALTVLGYLFYTTSLYTVYLVNLIFVSITQFFGPAEVSMIPALVHRKQIITATSLFNITWTASQLVGIVLLAPWLIKFFGPPIVFSSAAAIYLVATILVATLPGGKQPARTLRSLRRETLIRDIRGELRDALDFITTDRQTWWTMLNYTVGNALMLVIAMLTPRYMVSVLDAAPEDVVYVFAPAGAGILLITVLLTPLSGWLGKNRLIDGGIVCTVGALFGIAALQTAEAISLPGGLGILRGILELPFRHGLVPPLMFLSAFLGVGYALLTVPSQAILLERAPAESRGRIVAVLLMLGNVAAILPLIVLGTLADRVGVNLILALLASLTATLAVVALRGTRVKVIAAPDH